ncbi:unnamed protein product [Effrenium voratum]|nr:unnamed protein product [Effrenium voratum]
MLFTTLALAEVALAVEAAVYGMGSWAHGGRLPLSLLTTLGRLRLLGAALAWPWLLPWAAELGCRCQGTEPLLVQFSLVAAGLLTAFYIWGELQLAIFSHPVDSGSSSGSMEMCLPSQTLLGGQFRLDKADLEETGRAVFVPAQPRHGLYAGAGLALLAHLGFGLAFKFPSWLLLGALGALAGRWFGSLPVPRKLKGRKHVNVWGREGPRLVCRVGELLWIGCCVLELQSCEASSRWLSVCQ